MSGAGGDGVDGNRGAVTVKEGAAADEEGNSGGAGQGLTLVPVSAQLELFCPHCDPTYP